MSTPRPQVISSHQTLQIQISTSGHGQYPKIRLHLAAAFWLPISWFHCIPTHGIFRLQCIPSGPRLLILRPTNHPLIALLCHPTKCEGLHQSFTRDVVCHHHQHHRGCKPILYLRVRIFDINFSTLIVSSLIVSHLSVQCQTSVCAL